jgi:hypothetical protein
MPSAAVLDAIKKEGLYPGAEALLNVFENPELRARAERELGRQRALPVTVETYFRPNLEPPRR